MFFGPCRLFLSGAGTELIYHKKLQTYLGSEQQSFDCHQHVGIQTANVFIEASVIGQMGAIAPISPTVLSK